MLYIYQISDNGFSLMTDRNMESIKHSYQQKETAWSWGDGSAIKSTGCSSRRLGLISSTHITCGNDSRLPATPLDFIGTKHTRDTHTCM